MAKNGRVKFNRNSKNSGKIYFSSANFANFHEFFQSHAGAGVTEDAGSPPIGKRDYGRSARNQTKAGAPGKMARQIGAASEDDSPMALIR
jgi:hypothetical protein